MQAQIESPSAINLVLPDADEETQVRQFTGAMNTLAGLFLGFVGNLFFYYTRPGLNIALYVLLVILVGLTLLTYFKQPIVGKNAIFAVPALVFALLLAVNTAPELLFFNTMMLAGSLFFAARYTREPYFLGGNPLAPVATVLQLWFVGWLKGPLNTLVDGRQWFKRVQLSNEQAAKMMAVLRGLLLTIPILALFGLLLSSADVVFGGLLSDVVEVFLPDSPIAVFTQCLLISLFWWMSMALYKLLLQGPIPNTLEARIKPLAEMEKTKPVFRLSMIESSMILGSVDLMFAAFVLIQARYLFGGEANINVQGYTYAEYARRGFYELLAVSLMTMFLVIVLDTFTHRKREREYLFRGLSIGMIALTVVILVAAYQRLNLYENAFGFTRIRVMSGVFMGWLAALFAALVIDILRRRQRLYGVACIVTALGFVLTLNLINMDGFIASRNIARYEDEGKLDVAYLLTLSDDAMPDVVRLLDDPTLSDNARDTLLMGLGERLYELEEDREARSALGFHWGKAQAWEALNEYREVLRPDWATGTLQLQ